MCGYKFHNSYSGHLVSFWFRGSYQSFFANVFCINILMFCTSVTKLIQNIRKFTSWNGFSRWLTDKFIRIFTQKKKKANTSDKTNNSKSEMNDFLRIWIQQLFPGNRGTKLIHICRRKNPQEYLKTLRSLFHSETSPVPSQF